MRGERTVRRGNPDEIVNARGETRLERAKRLEEGEKKLAAILAETAASYGEVESLLSGAKRWLYVTNRVPGTCAQEIQEK